MGMHSSMQVQRRCCNAWAKDQNTAAPHKSLAAQLSAKYPCYAGKSSSSQNRMPCKISRTLHDSAAITTLICGAHLKQGECEDGVVVAAQVRRQLVGPGQAQQQVGGHEVVVECPLEEELAAQHRLGHAAPSLACRTVALSTVYL